MARGRESAEQRKAQRRRHYLKYREQIQAKNRAYYHANREACRAQQKEYRARGSVISDSYVQELGLVAAKGWGCRTNEGP